MKYKTHLLLSLILICWSITVNSNKKNSFETAVKKLDGRTIKLGELISYSKPVYIKFWASWCQPCMEQMPHLQQTFEKYGKLIDVISVNLGVNDDLSTIAKVVSKYNLTMPVVIDSTQKLTKDYKLIGTPYHILLDSKGHIVHKGHKVDKALNNAIKLLALHKPTKLPGITLVKEKNRLSVYNRSQTPRVLFFTSTWCDWYLKKRRPKMSLKCKNAQNTINIVQEKYSKLKWTGVLSRLWTGKKELIKYKSKYGIKYPLLIDTTNELFRYHKVRQFPTLIAVINGSEIFRVQDFSNSRYIEKLLQQIEFKK